MNYHEAIVATLRTAREARAWTDEAVATDLCTQLGLDPQGEAKDAKPPPDDPNKLTPEQVTQHEQAAVEAVQRAKEARAQLEAQNEADGVSTAARPPPSTHPADLSPGTLEPNLPPVPAPAAALEAPEVQQPAEEAEETDLTKTTRSRKAKADE